MGWVLGNVGHQSQIISGASLSQEPFQRRRHRGGGFLEIEPQRALDQGGLFFRQASLSVYHGQEAVRVVLALLDIRLVECIDTQDRAYGGGGDLPAEEFLSQ